jgi:YVTN family beta-propeller protein
MPLAASSARIYALNRDGSSVTVIDAATNKVVQTINGVAAPRGAAFSPDGRLAYISSEEEHTLDVVDTETGKITKKIALSGHTAGNLMLTKDGKRVLLGLTPFLNLAVKHHDPEDSGGVDIIDTTSLERIKTIPIREGIHDIFMTPDGKYAVVGADTGKFATVIDLRTEEPAWKIPFEAGVLTIAIERGPDGSANRLFVELRSFNGFAVADFKSGKELARIDLPDPVRFGIPAATRKGGGPAEYNPTHGTDIAPDGKTLWVASRGTNHVYVYSLPELKLMRKVYMPERNVPGQPVDTSDPHWLIFGPDGKTVYVALAALDSVIAIDAKTLKEVARIPVGDGAKVLVSSALP